MFELNAWAWALAPIGALTVATWLVSIIKRDVSIVDCAWSLLFLAATLSYATIVPNPGPRTVIVILLVTLGALRLTSYITWRNWGRRPSLSANPRTQ